MLEQSLLRQWIEHAKAGDAAAFERIVVLHERLVLRLAQRILLNSEDAKDAAQEVFLRLHRNLRSFEAERDLTPWLYRMTVNIALDVARRFKRHAPLDATADAADSAANPEEAMLVSQRRALVMAALARLPERERAAIVLRDMEGLETSEVAEILGSSETTVRSQISTGRAKLKSLIEARLRRAT